MTGTYNSSFQDWFKKAQEDYLSAKVILKGKEGSPATVCFLSQQMAEKYLKGLLVFHQKSFPKVHDLLELETLLLPDEPTLKGCEAEIDFLNRYYIETRYPGDYPEFFWEEAEKAFVAASCIKSFAEEKINPFSFGI